MDARQAALDILCQVEQGAYFNLALKETLRGASAEDRRFAAALCFTVLENVFRLDAAIDHYTDGRRMKKQIRCALRLGAAQILFMDGVPNRAAVYETVQLVRKGKQKALAGFVNAVLRRIDAEGEPPFPSPEKDLAGSLSLQYSYPKWLVKEIIKTFGIKEGEALLSYRPGTRGVCIRANTLLGTEQELEASLQKAGLEWEKGRFSPRAYYVRGLSAADEDPLFQNGKMTVQSEASMLCGQAARVRPEMKVLDVCAAPGGKSAYMAQARPKELISCDLHPHRVELIQKTFSRLGVDGQARVQDGTVLCPEWEDAFDVVLADVPCTALGLLHRKPDLRLSRKPEELSSILPLQAQILERAAGYVRPGGALVYSTCTLRPQENREQAEKFLAAHPQFCVTVGWVPENLKDRLDPLGGLQLLPHRDGVDGFYICRMEKKG